VRGAPRKDGHGFLGAWHSVGHKLASMALGFSWFLILVAVVLAVMVVISNVYILVYYSHPEDKNQAWVPKGIIVFGLSLAVYCVLLYPLDVANTKACGAEFSQSSCTLTLPMHTIWLAVFIAILVMTFAIIPFTVFFYEADSDL
jgi:LMBR1 domain-containing protein 1